MTTINLKEISIVHWYPEKEKHKCGYCKNECGAVSYGMWAESLKVADYQSLIDRGWRRSGMYCYKPIMDETCCPQYTIKCNALDFQVSKSQKKIIKRLNKYLADGVRHTHEEPSPSTVTNADDNTPRENTILKDKPNVNFNLNHLSQVTNLQTEATVSREVENNTNGPMNSCSVQRFESSTSKGRSSSVKDAHFRKGQGPDPSKPPCKKAKLLRLEKKQEKLNQQGLSITKQHVRNEAKSLEELLTKSSPDAKAKLTFKMVPAIKLENELAPMRHLEYQLYKKYQMVIHNDPPEKCSITGFVRFLISSPLENVSGPTIIGKIQYGTFHQQYWLNDKLIAVAVLDILPKCVSSVYFFYDPDYRFLTLGTYASLREIYLAQTLHRDYPSLKYYYMGYYIHSCPKMHYKGKLSQSYLLCPETYKWFPIESCIKKLDVNKYCRLNDDIDAIDENACSVGAVDNIKIFVNSGVIAFGHYKLRYGEENVFANIGRLIGKECSSTLLFVSSF